MVSASGKAAADTSLREEAFDWLMRVEAAPRDAVVRAGLDAWLSASEAHLAAYRSVERMWRLSAGLKALDAKPVSVARPPGRWRRTRPVAATAAIAVAACLAFLLLPALQLRLSADYLTETAELRDVTLEDGSIVHLDGASAIAIRYRASVREVALLSGQAFFEVVPGKDRPFVVSADDVRVTVTGTAFSVGTYADAVSVAVRTGTVEVATEEGRHLAATLRPGDRAEVRKAGQVVRSTLAPDDVALWREGRLAVDGVPLAQVVEELRRHYSGVIVLRDRAFGERQITGVFDLRRPVEALQAVVRAQHGSVTEITPYMMVISAR